MVNPKKGLIIDKTISFFVNKYSKTGHNPKPVILHSLSVAFYLLAFDYELPIIQAAILHDLIEDSDVTSEEIQKHFGPAIRRLVDSQTFKVSVVEREKQYRELFGRTKKAGRKALIIKAADIYVNSLYINLVKNKAKEIFLWNKSKYFLILSKKIIGQEPVWKDLYKRSQIEKARIEAKYKTKL